jgi:predicted HicB family RNase H-like nuclease
MSTTTDPILDAIAAIESQEPGEQLLYRRAAEIFNVNRTTLSRRHKGKTQSNATAAKARQVLNLQQELELVDYIERCARQGLPPTREIVQNFALAIAQ